MILAVRLPYCYIPDSFGCFQCIWYSISQFVCRVTSFVDGAHDLQLSCREIESVVSDTGHRSSLMRLHLLGDWNLQEWKMTDHQKKGVEFAGLENGGLENDGLENDGVEQ